MTPKTKSMSFLWVMGVLETSTKQTNVSCCKKKLEILSSNLWAFLDFKKDRKDCIQARFDFLFSTTSGVPCLSSQEEDWGRVYGVQRFSNFE